jgi:ABC-type thiamine transport system substrate-binding protein
MLGSKVIFAPIIKAFDPGDRRMLDAAKRFFAPYRSPEAKVLPAQYIEKDGLWTATNVHIMIIMYNKKLVSEQEKPQTWSDLFNPKWRVMAIRSASLPGWSILSRVFNISSGKGFPPDREILKRVPML